MQYHWVVCFDEETNSFEIEWDLTYHALDGIVYDTQAPFLEGWSMPDEAQEEKFEEYSELLVSRIVP